MAEKILNIHQRIAQAMLKVDYIQKEKRSGMNYSIVSHDAVTAKCRPILLEAGVHYYPYMVSPSQNGNRTECKMIVRFVNIDDPSDFINVESFGYGIDAQDKGPGKARSYAVKYALLKGRGRETGDDPDLDQNVVHEARDFNELSKMVNHCDTLDALASLKNLLRDEAVSWSVSTKAQFNAAYAKRRDELKGAAQ